MYMNINEEHTQIWSGLCSLEPEKWVIYGVKDFRYKQGLLINNSFNLWHAMWSPSYCSAKLAKEGLETVALHTV